MNLSVAAEEAAEASLLRKSLVCAGVSNDMKFRWSLLWLFYGITSFNLQVKSNCIVANNIREELHPFYPKRLLTLYFFLKILTSKHLTLNYFFDDCFLLLLLHLQQAKLGECLSQGR